MLVRRGEKPEVSAFPETLDDAVAVAQVRVQVGTPGSQGDVSCRLGARITCVAGACMCVRLSADPTLHLRLANKTTDEGPPFRPSERRRCGGRQRGGRRRRRAAQPLWRPAGTLQAVRPPCCWAVIWERHAFKPRCTSRHAHRYAAQTVAKPDRRVVQRLALLHCTNDSAPSRVVAC